MRNHYTAIGAIGILSVILIVVGFNVVGSPVSQREIALDETRLQHFSTIQPAIEEYYRTNSRLPRSLDDLKTIVLPRDPQTQKDYEYKPQGPSSYELCADFSTDSKDNPDYSPTYRYPAVYHTKGHACIPYQVPDYVNAKPAPVTIMTNPPAATDSMSITPYPGR